ncbi:MAG TPA: nucleotidyltransferase family protein [Candidatus Acidoferrum sp.]|nr:nucleotidyltransferase family protein [Candidatus Acidoferrum sp.]
MLAAVILSGGASRRMGSPKALLPYQGRPFLEHLLEITKPPRIQLRRVVLGADTESIRKEISLSNEEIIVNLDWEKGQLSSLQAALRSLPPEVEAVLVCPVDHPLVSAALVDELIDAFQKTHAPVVVPVFEGRRGHPVIFSSAVFAELLAAPLDVGARAVVWAHKGEVVELSTNEEGCVLNLNDPDAFLKISGAPL